MPTIYEWTVPAPTSIGSSVASGAGIGTGVDGGRAYAFSREMNPESGDVVFDRSRRTWARSAPLAQKALRCLRVEKGTAARDPSYGAEWARLENATANAPAVARDVISEAFAPFTGSGEMVDLEIEALVEHRPDGAYFQFRVSFSDARGVRSTLEGRGTP